MRRKLDMCAEFTGIMQQWVLFSVLSAFQVFPPASAIRDYPLVLQQEVCDGEDFVFPFADVMTTRKVLFTPKSSPNSARLVMDEGRSLDHRFSKFKHIFSYKVKLLDASKDYEGTYSAVSPRINSTLPLVSLSVKDCSIKRKTVFGRGFSFEITSAVDQIDYSPSMDNQRTVIMWSRSKRIQRSRGTLENRHFAVKKPTYADQGYYTLRDKEGKLLRRYYITLEEVHQNHTHKTGDDLIISYPVDTVPYSLTYQSKHRSRRLVTLIKNGHLMDSEMFEGRIDLLDTGVEIRELEVEDGGTFKLRDVDQNVALEVELTVRTRTLADYGINYTVLMGAVVVAIVIFLCCCCCRENPTTTEATSVTSENQVYVHEPTTNYQRRTEPYNPGKPFTSAANQQPQSSNIPSSPVVFKHYNPRKPLASASSPQPQSSDVPGPTHNVVFEPYSPRRPLASPANQQPQASDVLNPPSNSAVAGGSGGLGPSSEFAASAHVGPTPFQGSAGGGVDAPFVTQGFDCLSSDSGTRFEVPKGLNYPSAPLLSSDTTSYDVYTSDKFNFNFL